jgi:hypothetical protein
MLGSCLVLCGALLAWNPRAFLNRYNRFIDRSRSMAAAWHRRNLYSDHPRALAVALIMAGLYIIYATLSGG